MANFNSINLRTNEYAGRKVDQIELHAFDMRFHKDITCNRDVRLARRMAEELGIKVHDFREPK